MKQLPKKVRIFLWTKYILTIISIFIFSMNNEIKFDIKSYAGVLFFIVLIALTESFTVLFRGISFSTGFAVQLATFMIFGPVATMLIIVAGFSFRIMKVNGKLKHIMNTPIYGTLSNYCIFILMIIYGNFAFKLFGGVTPVDSIFYNLVPVVIFSLAVFFINALIISIIYSFMTNKGLIFSIVINFKLLFMNILLMVPFGIILVHIFKKYSYSGVLLVLFPIILARYTFSLYIEAKSKYVQTVDVLMNAMEARDKYTQGHSKRVAQISETIAKELKYDQWRIENLIMAAMLHDVGKIGVDDGVLNKPGKLTDEEFEAIKRHPEIGYNILKGIKDIEKVNFIVRHHHERYDGKGYPNGKTAEELNLDVFIIQLADSVDAMATDRPYRKALGEEEIIKELVKCKGTQFHPKVVEAYLNIVEKSRKAE